MGWNISGWLGGGDGGEVFIGIGGGDDNGIGEGVGVGEDSDIEVTGYVVPRHLWWGAL